jgi:oligopeptide/dipeptide ABC transporter ATP-binding protein
VSALLEVRNLTKEFAVGTDILGRPKAVLRAVDDLSFDVLPGETLGFVGESGCGKTTVGRLALRLLTPTAGTIRFDGEDITSLTEREMRPKRRHLQVVFQDPYSSLNPRLMVRDIIGEPLRNFGFSRAQIDERVAELMRIVGLPPEYRSRYPHAFSGGQRQRIGIARALAVSPKLIVCDEAVSALDVSIQAQILNLLSDLQSQFGMALLFISHNLGVVRHVSHRIAVMYLGRLVELSDEDALFERPLHPYTAALIAAVPEPDPATRGALSILPGEIPSPLNPPPGCPFNTRCPKAEARCRAELPEFREIEPRRWVRCHFPG